MIKWRGVAYWDWSDQVEGCGIIIGTGGGASDQVEGCGIVGLEGVHLIKWRGVALGLEGLQVNGELEAEGMHLINDLIKWRGVAFINFYCIILF